MTLQGFLCAASATLMAQQVVPGLVAVHVPTQAAYSLDGACHWHPRPWVLYLGPSMRPRVDGPSQAAEARCWRSHGAAGAIPFLKVIEAKWPSNDQFARWESEDAAALHAPHARKD